MPPRLEKITLNGASRHQLHKGRHQVSGDGTEGNRYASGDRGNTLQNSSEAVRRTVGLSLQNIGCNTPEQGRRASRSTQLSCIW